MKLTTSDKVIAYLTLLSGLTISAVAVWYSVAGLVSIFAAAVTPIIVMGVALEISKLIATVWLKMNWGRAPNLIKIYLSSAIAILMVITSMGIFGFLSKAHSDQSLVSGDVLSKIAIYDEKIKTAKDNIDADRKAIKQMDDAVDQTMGRSTSEGGADKAVQIRRSQQKERARLSQDIEAEQKKINQLMDERAPIAAEVRAVEAEVGPIKYIAAFVYGDNPDANVLEKAVTWVIIIIVSVFDPLAVILLLASQYSFQWFRQDEERKEEDNEETQKTTDESEDRDPDIIDQAIVEESSQVNEPPQEIISVPEVNQAELKFQKVPKELLPTWSFKPLEFTEDDYDNLNIPIIESEESWSSGIPSPDIAESTPMSEKDVMHKWKGENPTKSLKQYRKLYQDGVIKSLPWEEVTPLERPGDHLQTDNAESWMENVDGHQVKRSLDTGGYIQNAEQGDNTLWKRVKHNTDE